MMFFCVFRREEKKLRNCPGGEQKPRKVVSSSSLKVLGAFYSPKVFFKAKGHLLQKALDWVDFDTPGKILIFNF